MTGQIFDPHHGPTAALGERGRTLVDIYRILRGNAVATELQPGSAQRQPAHAPLACRADQSMVSDATMRDSRHRERC
jgi:hypothetical protein